MDLRALLSKVQDAFSESRATPIWGCLGWRTWRVVSKVLPSLHVDLKVPRSLSIGQRQLDREGNADALALRFGALFWLCLFLKHDLLVYLEVPLPVLLCHRPASQTASAVSLAHHQAPKRLLQALPIRILYEGRILSSPAEHSWEQPWACTGWCLPMVCIKFPNDVTL